MTWNNPQYKAAAERADRIGRELSDAEMFWLFGGWTPATVKLEGSA
jgi:hypothetical protein